MGELLHDIEKRRLRRAYREYYKIHRNNFFASLAHFPGLWESFMLLDEIFVREFDDMYHMRDEDAVTPLMLFMNGHKQIRTAMELGFAGDSLEAWNTMRMAIDCTYQACKILADPTLGHIWAKGRKEDAPSRKAFTRAFLKDKTEGFETLGLRGLLELWYCFSDWSHASVDALCRRFGFQEEEPGQQGRTLAGVNYLETDEKILALSLQQLLQAGYLIEKEFFKRFQTRLA